MERQNARILNLQNSHGRTALHYACSEGNDLTTESLLNLGAIVEKYVPLKQGLFTAEAKIFFKNLIRISSP